MINPSAAIDRLVRHKRLLTGIALCIAIAVTGAAASQISSVRSWALRQFAPDCAGQFNAEELRLQVIKNYLKILLVEHLKNEKKSSRYELALVPKVFDAESIKQGLRDASLMKSVTTNRMVLPDTEAIKALGATSLSNNMTAAISSTHYRSLLLTPLASIRSVSAADAHASLSTRSYIASFQLNSDEKARGFGAAYFLVDQFPDVELACCDGRGEHHGLSPAWHVNNDIKTLRANPTRFLVVNSCGDLLVRKLEDEVFFRF